MKDHLTTEYFKEKYKDIPQVDEYIKIMIKAKINPRDIEHVLDIIAHKADPIFIEAKLGPEMALKIRKHYLWK
jgi:tRNA1(Val) A37 N6-methylase TrmN6